MQQSGFMAKQLAMRQALIEASERVTQQLLMDTLQITLHEFGWGYDRIMKLTKAWADAYNHYHDTLDVKNVEADVLREHLDRELAGIMKDKQELIRFEDRYPEIKEITYGSKK